MVAFFTENVKFLVSFTGSYGRCSAPDLTSATLMLFPAHTRCHFGPTAGVGIQYVIPTTLLIAARNKQRNELGSRDINVHK